MPPFKQKKIQSIETLGEKLKRHRKDYGVSLDKAARQMQVNSRYLRVLEADNYLNMPADVYTKNFIKRYAKYLKLNPDTVVSIYEQEKKIFFNTRTQKKQDKIPHPLKHLLNFVLKPNTLKVTIIGFIFALVLLYLGFSVNKIFAPPELIIKSPDQQSIITEARTIYLDGITEKEVDLTINAKPVLADQDGRFSLNLDLQKGLNIIKITAKKKHSKINTVYRQVIVKDSKIDD